MAEQRFLRSPQSAGARPLAPNPNRTEIHIHWREGLVEAIAVLHHHIEAATQARFIYLKQGCLQAYDAQFAWDAQAQIIIASRPGRRAI